MNAWYQILRGNTNVLATPIPFLGRDRARDWANKNQPLFKEELIVRPCAFDEHLKFIESVTGDNALTK